MNNETHTDLENLSPEDIKWLYSTMVRIRRFEEEVSKQFMSNKIPGLLHIHAGEEAIDAAVFFNMRSDDYVVSTYRYCHAANIARGADPKRVMAEMYGKVTGFNRGRGGDMHVLDHDHNLLLSSAIVGAQIPIALGAALKFKLKGEDRIVVCFLGDGATNQGTFHESLNLAALWKLPVVFVVDNNQFAASTPRRLHQTVEKISTRAVAYNIPGVTVEDGNDLMELLNTMKKSFEHVRNGNGPILVECVTFNLQQARQYYSKAPFLEDWKKKYGDPISRFGKLVTEAGLMDPEELDKIVDNAKLEMDEAVKFADSSEYPDESELVADVYFIG